MAGEKAAEGTSASASTTAVGRRFDLELFEQLAAEYAERPMRAEPVRRDQKSQREKAEARVAMIQGQLELDFKGRVILDLGCGHGWLAALLPELSGAKRAIGVDPRRYDTWAEHTDDRVSLIQADMTVDHVVDEGTVDCLISGAVLEHVERPIEMLAAIHAALVPGGRAWLNFNLHRGPSASHRYNEIPFPWPHLLFDDDVCREFYRRAHGRNNVPFAWVNRMTIANYVHAVHEIGFRLVSVKRRVVPIDVGFFLRFEPVLGRYPALDLETDFATLVLEKENPGRRWRASRSRALPELGYLERQRSLDAAIAAEQGPAKP